MKSRPNAHNFSFVLLLNCWQGGHIYATAENNVADNLPVEIVTRAATLTQFLGPHGPLVLGPIGDPVDALVMDLPWSQVFSYIFVFFTSHK